MAQRFFFRRGMLRARISNCSSGKLVPRKVGATVRGTNGHRRENERIPGIPDQWRTFPPTNPAGENVFLARQVESMRFPRLFWKVCSPKGRSDNSGNALRPEWGKVWIPGISDAEVEVGGRGGGWTNRTFLLRGSLGGSTSRMPAWMSWRITQQRLRSASKRACHALDYASTGASSRRLPRPFTATTSKATCACAVPRYART